MSFDVKKKIEELNKSDIISGSNARYDIVLEEELKDLNSAGIILRHKKSGARVVVISNDDNNKVFSIGFKTPPFNDTGMQHIIEHSTLCGSRKYPVKDPFVELCKGITSGSPPDSFLYTVSGNNDTNVYLESTSSGDENAPFISLNTTPLYLISSSTLSSS